MKRLKIKKLRPEAHPPQRANEGDLGYDLFVLQNTSIDNGATQLVGTGIALEFPKGWGGVIKDRSSMAMRGIFTSAGVIDNGYRGEVKIVITNHSGAPLNIERNQKIAQMIPVPVTNWGIEVINDLGDSERGEGGFGSSGTHK